jgi:hypothetical protein
MDRLFVASFSWLGSSFATGALWWLREGEQDPQYRVTVTPRHFSRRKECLGESASDQFVSVEYTRYQRILTAGTSQNCVFQGHGRTSPPLSLRLAVNGTALLSHAASFERSSLAWAPLFVLQYCEILLWPWSKQFYNGSRQYNEFQMSANDSIKRNQEQIKSAETSPTLQFRKQLQLYQLFYMGIPFGL